MDLLQMFHLFDRVDNGAAFREGRKPLDADAFGPKVSSASARNVDGEYESAREFVPVHALVAPRGNL